MFKSIVPPSTLLARDISLVARYIVSHASQLLDKMESPSSTAAPLLNRYVRNCLALSIASAFDAFSTLHRCLSYIFSIVESETQRVEEDETAACPIDERTETIDTGD